MTADVYPFDMGFLNRVAARIVNEVRGINRVTYDITSKPPGTIEWEQVQGLHCCPGYARHKQVHASFSPCQTAIVWQGKLG
jgi:hypothetical protein